MALVSGSYLVKNALRVVVWPAPDFQGDGPPVLVEQFDSFGRNMGRTIEKDQFNRVKKRYSAPAGFRDVRGYDGTANYVYHNEYGEVYRQPNGDAVPIAEGQALVFRPDGSVQVLSDEYAQWVFESAHDALDEEGNVVASNEVDGVAFPEIETEEEILTRRLAEIKAERGE